MEIFSPRRKPRTITQGRGAVLSLEGDVLWEDPDWIDNALADEGEENLLSVYLKETAHLTKYLALIEGGTTPPAETSTMLYLGGGAGAKETRVPTPVDGYARQQVLAADWTVPALEAADMQSSAAEKTFGPASGTAWTGLTHAALVTAATGQIAASGKFLLFLALSGTTTVAIGQSFKYTLRQKAQ